jgi:cell division transport system permease protein
MARQKLDARSFAHQRRKRRQWLTFVRMCRYGVNNFSRNAWLSLAATAVMTITLLVILAAVVARTALLDTAAEVRDKVNMSIYLKTETTNEQAESVRQELLKLSTVRTVSYESPAQAREEFAKENKNDPETLAALNTAKDSFYGTLNIKIADINDPSQLQSFVKDNETVKKYIDARQEPTFEGGRSTAISTIGRWVVFAEQIGIGAAILFTAISSLIVFNTIRMAIFNRKEEINMMKLIGADRGFIRGPFIVEAVFYGFIAAVIATTIGLLLLHSVKDNLQDYGIQIQNIANFTIHYLWAVVLGMILVGALIGIISSLFATRKYLKI